MSLRPASLFPLVLALLACSAASNGPSSSGNNEQDTAGEPAGDGDAGASADAEAGAVKAGGNPDADTSQPGAGPAGKSGAAAFAAQICEHEAQCDLIDASASTCQADFESYYEMADANPWAGPTSPPPLELYRADYVSALGACIASASCGGTLSMTETACNTSLLEAPSDGGAPTIAPTQALSAFCAAFAASTCLAGDSGVQDCATTLALYNDDALNTGTACLAGTDCPSVSTCFSAAFTQQ